MTQPIRPKRILLVDDEQDILMVTKTTLEVMGDFVTEACSSAVEALECLKSFEPDLILVDVMMPDLDGISFVRELKRRPDYARIPVIFLTARTQSADIEAYLDEGALDVVSKPFDPEELVQKLLAVWRKPEERETSLELTRQLRELQDLYIRQLPEKIGLIESLWTRASVTDDQAAFKKFYRLVHGMAGAGATFGFNTLSIMARVLENFLRPMVDEGRFPDDGQRGEIVRTLALLKEAAEKPESELSVDEVTLPIQERRSSKLVYLFEEDDQQRIELIRQLEFFGYSVVGFSSFEPLNDAVRQQAPSVLIATTNRTASPWGGIAAVSELNQEQPLNFPLIFLSEKEDLDTHLQALRAGGKAFFVKPVDVGELADKLDLLSGQNRNEPFRILIVEDDAELAAFYKLTLERHGIKCMVIHDALQVMSPVRSFRPDLVLLDVYMANCSGLELASMLRQRESLLGISIVFLSTEAALETQSAGIALGAEDYLTKPIQADHLVSVLLPRLERSRILRNLMDTDGLTGLLNHTKTKEHLETQVKLSNTGRKSDFVFVMIDIDHFKRVNDTYGHPTGDRILRSLARLLKQRLRRNDIIGRYGGEEFAIILPETDLSEGVRLFEEIRASFASVGHNAGGKEFRVTFSCGVAAWPDFSDTILLSDAADSALYQAKAEGRNRVVAASRNHG